MLKSLCLICICLAALPLVCETGSHYQVGTITDVKQHQAAGSESNDILSYDVSLKVGDTVYITLYTPPFGMNTVKYAAGREVLVLVGKKTITYNDMLGHPVEVFIISQKAVLESAQS